MSEFQRLKQVYNTEMMKGSEVTEITVDAASLLKVKQEMNLNANGNIQSIAQILNDLTSGYAEERLNGIEVKEIHINSAKATLMNKEATPEIIGALKTIASFLGITVKIDDSVPKDNVRLIVK